MIQFRITGAAKLDREMSRDIPERMTVVLSRLLTKWARELRDTVVNGRYFDNPTPNLQTDRGVWAEDARVKVKGGPITARTGWVVPYGYGLEHGRQLGPQTVNAGSKQSWVVERGLKVYMAHRRTPSWTRVIKSTSQRPHWSVALDKLRPKWDAALPGKLREAGL